MKLLLRKDIARLGLAGDVVDVKEGYARNYLIPQHLALLPTAGNMKRIEEDKRLAEAERAKVRADLEARIEKLREVEVTIAAACNPEGQLYGSVGPREISAALRDEGHNVEAKHIELHESIKRIDTVTVPVIFGDDLKVEVKVWVVREGGSGELEEPAPEPQQDQQEHQGREARSHGYGTGVDALDLDL